MTDDHRPQEPQEPAGPDRLQRFNSARLLIVSVALIVFASVQLLDALRDGGEPLIFAGLLTVGVIGAIFGFRLVRRHWVKRDGLTLDEADPKRSPEEQRRRDDRVRSNKADMTPRQEVSVGLILIPVAGLFGALPLMTGEPFNCLLAIGLAIIGIVLLIRGLVRLGKR
ncbi:hypothetical protein ACFSBZ_13400 [Amnibacterium flavum]|nr:hypothetical protein [Amnibacterium flavum]